MDLADVARVSEGAGGERRAGFGPAMTVGTKDILEKCMMDRSPELLHDQFCFWVFFSGGKGFF